MEQIRFLKEYQDLQASESTFKEMLRALPQAASLKKLKQIIEREQQLLRAGKVDLKDLEKREKNVEFEIKERQDKVNQINNRAFGGRTTNIRELEALDLQQQGVKEEISRLEDEMLMLLEAIEVERTRLSTKSKFLKETTDEFKILLDEYRQEQATINQKLQELPENLHRLSSKIDKTLLSEYNVKKERYGRDVIVEVKQQTCQGCHMVVSFEVLKKIRSGIEVTYCDKCGRILLKLIK